MNNTPALPKDLHIAVLMGGWANERPVSLMSGNGVADALEERGHRVTRHSLYPFGPCYLRHRD